MQVFELSETTVTTTVTVTFNEERTDEVTGSGLWQMDLWFSKSPDGAGSSSDGVSDVLSVAQGSQPLTFDNFQFQVKRKIYYYDYYYYSVKGLASNFWLRHTQV